MTRRIQSAIQAPGPVEATFTVVRQRHVGRTALALVALLTVALVGQSVVTNQRFRWDLVGHYLFSKDILAGLGTTIQLTVISMVLAVILGTLVALMRLSGNPVLAACSAAFTWFFRGTPLIVQIIFFYYVSALYPTLSIGIPFGPQFASVDANTLMTPFAAAVLALTLNEAAYMSEIVRSGISAISSGQTEAARALGMSRVSTTWRIVLPQAMRLIVPPTGNETINMLKATALVSVIALAELLYSAQLIYSRTFETIPLLVVVTLWYLALTTVLSFGQFLLERHFARGHDRARSTGIARSA